MIDWTRIAELRSEIGDEDLDEVVGLFLEETDEVIARLSGGVAVSTLESDLHFLKGSALNLGFSALAEMCQTGERMAASGSGASIDLQPIIALYYASKVAFLQGTVLDPAA
jgi:histidine phosphotransfer protein HptB